VDVAQLCLSVLTPLLLLLVGVPVAQRTKRMETDAWVDQKIIERRLALYDEVGDKLNDLYCLSTFVGHFRSIEPPQAVAHKRFLDLRMHVNRPIFSPRVLEAYHRFIDVLFATHGGAGRDARLRIDAERLQNERGTAWDASWGGCFAADGAAEPKEVAAAYTDLVDAFAADLVSPRPERR
jgi:hypothetical protein